MAQDSDYKIVLLTANAGDIAKIHDIGYQTVVDHESPLVIVQVPEPNVIWFLNKFQKGEPMVLEAGEFLAAMHGKLGRLRKPDVS